MLFSVGAFRLGSQLIKASSLTPSSLARSFIKSLLSFRFFLVYLPEVCEFVEDMGSSFRRFSRIGKM